MTHRVVIVGAGISGLVAAHRLTELREQLQLPIDIILLDAYARIGGVIGTTRHSGFLMEHGPDAFVTNKPWAVDLCRRLGLGPSLIGTSPIARRSFVLLRGRLVPVPDGVYLMAPVRTAGLWRSPLMSWRGKVRMAGEAFVPRHRTSDDESVASFVRRRFGTEALQRIGQPMIGGMYAGDPERLSIEATLPQLPAFERRYGSVLRGLRKMRSGQAGDASGPRYGLFVTLRHGLKSLLDALRARLPDDSVRTNARVDRLETGPNWRLQLQNGRIMEADSICLAVPAPQAAALLQKAAPGLSARLDGIRYETVVTVNFGFRDRELPASLHGAGFVVPASERRPLLGCSFSSLKFADRAPEGGWLVRAFLGGAQHRDLLTLENSALARVVHDELQRVLGVSAHTSSVLVTRHPSAMPQYEVGHLSRVAGIEDEARRFPGLYLLGNAYRGVGLPDCIWLAERVAERIAGLVSGVELASTTNDSSDHADGD